VSIVLGLATSRMSVSSVQFGYSCDGAKPVSIVLGLATCRMSMSFVQFCYRCDSCELEALGYCWVP
jgi:hypothetical protein